MNTHKRGLRSLAERGRVIENQRAVLRLPRRALILALVSAAITAGCAGPIGPEVPELVSPPADAGLAQPAAIDPSPSPATEAPAQSREQVKRMLQESARRHGVNPNLVMGVAWWESGWDQTRVSSTGAIGIMQVEPATADAAGPLLLHRVAAVHDPADNIELGTAVLKENLDRFDNDLSKALVAYYAGPAAVRDWKDQDAESKRYVWGVYRLALAFSNGTGPA